MENFEFMGVKYNVKEFRELVDSLGACGTALEEYDICETQEDYENLCYENFNWLNINIVKKYDYAHDFYDGLSRITKDEKYGYIDKAGNEVIPCIYDWCCYFSEGLADVKKDGKYFKIDKTGKRV